MQKELWIVVLTICTAGLALALNRLWQKFKALETTLLRQQHTLQELELRLLNNPAPPMQQSPSVATDTFQGTPTDHVIPLSPATQAGVGEVGAPASLPPPLPSFRQTQAQPPQAASFAQRWSQRTYSWFTTGNIPVKIGVLVLFAGVAALLNYASDQGWLQTPVWLRLLGVALAAMGALWFAWTQRARKPVFARSLQGGSIGILLLIVFAAYRVFNYLPLGAAFGLTLGLLALTTALALTQNAMALAIFALLGGFLAPIWLTSGAADHVALFSYYALLNLAIFYIALRRLWHGLSLLGFVFTFSIASLWGVLQYDWTQYASAQSFLALFFGLYLLIPLLQAKAATKPPAWVESTLVLAVPLWAFVLQAALLQWQASALAKVAIGAALLYAALAWLCKRWTLNHNANAYQRLQSSYVLLAIGFATLSIPLLFSARATACIFALQGTALTWLGLKRQQRPMLYSAVGLHMLALLGFAIMGMNIELDNSWIAVSNPVFSTGMWFVANAMGTAYAYVRYGKNFLQPAGAQTLASLYYACGLLLGVAFAWNEISFFAPQSWKPSLQLLLFASLGLCAAWLYRRALPFAALRYSALALGIWLPVWHWLWVEQFWYPPSVWHFAITLAVCWLAGWTILAWAGHLTPGTASIQARPVSSEPSFATSHEPFSSPYPNSSARMNALGESSNTLWWLHWAAVVTVWIFQWQAPLWRDIPDLLSTWAFPLLCLPSLLLASVAAWRPRWLRAGNVPWGLPLLRAIALASAAIWAGPALLLAGKTAPLPWFPIFNPQDLVLLACCTLLIYRKGFSPTWMASLGMLWLSKSTLAAVHHWAGMDWRVSAMLESALAQASLTLLWGVLAVAAWIYGSRSSNRTIWRAGLGIMTLVLLKLLAIDRAHLGNLWGIASFIGYGLLCVIVGYLAPTPAKEKLEQALANTSKDSPP